MTDAMQMERYNNKYNFCSVVVKEQEDYVRNLRM